MNSTTTRAGLGLALALVLLAAGAQARTAGEQAVAAVGEHLRANDCAGAVKSLNAALAAGYPEAALLAGNMFEAGFCVGKNRDKAVSLYSQASEGGVKEGSLRLAAGFAAAEHGPDPAAALWWAKRARLEAGGCTTKLPATDDPDQFVQELAKWPKHELAICNHVVGTLSFIYADVHYPFAGVGREISGRSEGYYRPATRYFDASDSRDGTNRARMGMAEVITRAISLAGARYPKPANMDPDWTIPYVFIVDTDKSRWW